MAERFIKSLRGVFVVAFVLHLLLRGPHWLQLYNESEQEMLEKNIGVELFSSKTWQFSNSNTKKAIKIVLPVGLLENSKNSI